MSTNTANELHGRELKVKHSPEHRNKRKWTQGCAPRPVTNTPPTGKCPFTLTAYKDKPEITTAAENSIKALSHSVPS